MLRLLATALLHLILPFKHSWTWTHPHVRVCTGCGARGELP